MRTGYTLPLGEIGKDDFNLVGGKGFHLGELVRLKLPVPGGFVVTTNAFDKFLEENKLKDRIDKAIESCSVDNVKELLEMSKTVEKMVTDAGMPKGVREEVLREYDIMSKGIGKGHAIVAVRSSGVAEDLPQFSFAGQHETYLNVTGGERLLEAIVKCWASLFESRAIFYRAKNKIPSASIAVVIQNMVDSEKSGVIFTVNPSTGDDNIVIESTWGLGESLVQGEVEPDKYIVSKAGKILDVKIGRKERMKTKDAATTTTVTTDVPKEKVGAQVLTRDEILGLSKYAMDIEKFYNHPQDIEFAIARNTINIVQTRNVTTEVKREKELDVKERPIVKGIAASPGIVIGRVKIVGSIEELEKIHQGDILVTKMTNPDYVVAMSKSAAIITDEGGMTSHASIVSREMGIPCVVGAGNATKILKENEMITVDAQKGAVYRGIIKLAREEKVKYEYKETKTKIYMNLAVPEKIDDYKKLPFDGIGLMRVEFIIATYIKEHPNYLIEIGQEQRYIDKLAEGIAKIAGAIAPRPVVVRFSDFKTNEYRDLKGGEKFEPVEANPLIGWRGVSRYISPEFEKAFRLECKAIKRVREALNLKNVWVMLPFVRTVWEVEKCQKIMEEEGLKRGGKDFKVWAMIEVPSAIFLADEFSKYFDGFSIGSNDLTMLILGIDRDSNMLAHMGYFDERNDAVKRAIKHLIDVARKKGVTVSICGQGPSNYPDFTEFLVKSGITSVSVNPDTVEKTRQLVYQTESKLKSK